MLLHRIDIIKQIFIICPQLIGSIAKLKKQVNGTAIWMKLIYM